MPVIVISGTSRGIGYAAANYFLARDFSVIGCSRGQPLIKHSKYSHYQVDTSKEEEVRRWAREVKKKFGRIDIIVCNVGLVNLGSVVGATSLMEFKGFIDAILISTFLVCREFAKIMTLQGYGRIINITSIHSELHTPGTCAYSSAKMAVVEFTKVLAKEVARYGVTCNIVSPSLVNTQSASAFGEEWAKNILSAQTIQRKIEPDELCSIIEFFAKPESSLLTGQILHTCYVN